MPLDPRTKEQIEQEMIASVLTDSELTDVAPGSVLLTFLGAIAEQMEAIEWRLGRIRDSFDFGSVSGQDLDERVAQFPPPSMARLPATAAVGPAMEITRATTTSQLVIPAGALRFKRTDNPDVQYFSLEEVTMEIGEDTYPPDSSTSPIRIACSALGTAGDAPVGVINQIVEGPDDLLTATNVNEIRGQDRESDAELRERARQYLASLARTQPQAIEFLARSFVSTDGVRARHAFAWEDPQNYGYTELVADDGFGFQGATRAGLTVTSTVPVQGQTKLWHEGPATAPITTIEVDSGSGFVTVAQVDPSTGLQRWVSVHERGLIEVVDASLLASGDVWRVSGYEVFTGWISELQREIEGDPASLSNVPGWRASGSRVVVTRASTQDVSFTVNLVVYSGVDLNDLATRVTSEIIAYVASLPPGEPLFLSQLSADLVRVFPDELRNFTFSAPPQDVYAQNSRTKLTTRLELIEVI
jgi:uncharacterized phage protein gp47/JayE